MLLCRSLRGGGGGGLQAEAIAVPGIAEADLAWRETSAGKRIDATEPWTTSQKVSGRLFPHPRVSTVQ